MILYKRTDAGNAVALDPRSPLPRKLRTLLIAVDGKTWRDTYVNSLSSFGDVAALLESLEQQGYIARMGTEDTGPDTHPNTPWQHTNTQATLQQDSPLLAPSAIDSAFASAGIRNSATPSDEVSSWARFQSNPLSMPPARPLSAARVGAAPSSAQYQLRGAISLMSDFVTTYLPADSLEIVLTLEGLSSVEQVIASLKGYQAMIATAGESARRHMAELRTLLASQ